MRHLLLAGLVALLATNVEAKLMSRTITYKAGETILQGYLVYDEAVQGKRPGVLVFPEWWGLTDFPRHKADQLAQMGYVALAADMFGNGLTTDDPKQAAKLVGELTPQVLRQRAQAALEELKKVPNIDTARIAAIGFCFGGKVALQLAYSGAGSSRRHLPRRTDPTVRRGCPPRQGPDPRRDRRRRPDGYIAESPELLARDAGHRPYLADRRLQWHKAQLHKS